MCNRTEEPDGYAYGVVKVDRKIDGYMGVVETPAKYSYTGLFSTRSKAMQWCRHIVARDRRAPLFPGEH